ncbi:MAG: thiosulfate sulfurtransferase [Acidiferrobacteraceae bacterium]|jgi:rhodanese-related sulfurtransferase|nr:thiosulfate sulfurtransferase [Acidiferrobacteraceae bacterium]MBT3974637.1 thiosulfate sulfurtransferase [Acidiferrobacteraceae bacterium]MBT7181686.1 thiosulfate sulfurtransferase [Acidiferrobacteraceae bacterium]
MILMRSVSAVTLKEQLTGGEELALVDVREEGAYARSHLLLSVSIPLDRLEVLFAGLVPRHSTPIVLCDDNDGWTLIAGNRLKEFGYSSVSYLKGGIQSWSDAGYELFSGVNVPSKAFGEFIEHEYRTPHLPAQALKEKIEANENIVVLDSRPLHEFRKMTIPGAICCPGAELVYRLPDLVSDPQTLVVVNCAGRTRSIIGAQSLINAGITNRVTALKDGTMGWHLAGYTLENGSERSAPEISTAGLEKSQEYVEKVRQRFQIRTINCQQLKLLREASTKRSLFLLDVRSPQEFHQGHMPGSKSAPGGQLVQATDEYVGVRNAQLVLIDDTGVRATMTASWLIQMGWREVYVLEDGLSGDSLRTGPETSRLLGADKLVAAMITVAALEGRRAKEEIEIFDVANSLVFRDGHLPGAHRISRTDISEIASRAASWDSTVVITSSDGTIAGFAAAELLSSEPHRQILVLQGGTDAWQAAGHPIEQGADPYDGESAGDVWYRPYERADAVEAAMQAYLDWEVDLVDQVARDGTAMFQKNPNATDKVT